MIEATAVATALSCTLVAALQLSGVVLPGVDVAPRVWGRRSQVGREFPR